MDFWEKDIADLGRFIIESKIPVVGYNLISFDMPVIANYVGKSIMNVPMIDLMVALYRKIGFRPKLDDVATATLGRGKIGHGYDAVKYYAAGQMDELKKYCMEDVRITKDIYDFGLTHGKVKYFDRNGFEKETVADWSLGEKVPVEEADSISMF
jgi:DEAD/DEAH box helicase domain-containing protein